MSSSSSQASRPRHLAAGFQPSAGINVAVQERAAHDRPHLDSWCWPSRRVSPAALQQPHHMLLSMLLTHCQGDEPSAGFLNASRRSAEQCLLTSGGGMRAARVGITAGITGRREAKRTRVNRGFGRLWLRRTAGPGAQWATRLAGSCRVSFQKPSGSMSGGASEPPAHPLSNLLVH